MKSSDADHDQDQPGCDQCLSDFADIDQMAGYCFVLSQVMDESRYSKSESDLSKNERFRNPDISGSKLFQTDSKVCNKSNNRKNDRKELSQQVAQRKETFNAEETFNYQNMANGQHNSEKRQMLTRVSSVDDNKADTISCKHFGDTDECDTN